MNALASAIDQTGEAAPAGNQMMPRATIESIVAHRNKTLVLYEQAHQALFASKVAVEKANSACYALTQKENRFNYHSHEEKVKFLHGVELAEREDYMKKAKKIVDTEVWSHIIAVTDLERLMDKQAKDELHSQLTTEPPEVTVENIQATLQQFCLDADTIFKRGIANCFTKLDRRFRSHDGWKIGGRVILTYMFDGNGYYNYNRDMESVLMDIERTFLVVDGQKVPPNYAGIAGALHHQRSGKYGGHGPRQTFIEDEFFRIKAYKNGNCHVWFQREDLVEKVNKLLGEYYGAPIPEECEPEDDGGLFTPKTTLAKNYGFFPTPPDAVEKVMEAAYVRQSKKEPRLKILEPSAGTGNLARRCVVRPDKPESRNEWDIKRTKEMNDYYRFDNIVDCVEIQPDYADQLKKEGIYRKVTCCDFLAMKPDPNDLYDRVVMNPPFDRERDIDHVVHAMQFLKADGYLVAVMSSGTEFRDTRKSNAFRAMMKKLNARIQDLPAGSFASVGTYCNTIVLTVWKNGNDRGSGRGHHRFE